MKEVIRLIESGNPMDGSHYMVGRDGITKIQDASTEWEGHIDFIYWIFAGEQRIAEWINVPVKLTYFKEGDTND